MNYMPKHKGFSLIELLIVVAIILIIAAIAIPNLMRARMAANDSSAAGAEHAIVVAEVGYIGSYINLGYGTLAQLGGSASPCIPNSANGCLIDNNLATNGGGNGKSGYNFTVTTGGTLTTGFNYVTTATPFNPGNSVTGTKAYCAVDDEVVRTQPAGVTTAVGSYAACQALNAMQN
jgi:type IV pilus assembly protein PilA